MKTKKENSFNTNQIKGDKKMKTMKMMAFIAAMFLGVMLNAQTLTNGKKSVNDQIRFDQLKIMLMEKGAQAFVMFGIINESPDIEQERLYEKCVKEQDVRSTCAGLRKQGAKPHPY